MDKIKLKGLSFYGYHGVFPEENRLGQRFVVNVTMYLPLKQAGQTDEMKHSVDYGDVYEAVKRIVEGKPKKLLEAVAEQIAADLFDTFPLIQALDVEVVKPNPPIRGHYEAVAVEIHRERNE